MKISLFAVCALFAAAQEKQVVVVEKFSLSQSPFISRSDMLCQNSRDQIVSMHGRVQSADLQPVVDNFFMMQCNENQSIPAIERALIANLQKRLSDDTK